MYLVVEFNLLEVFAWTMTKKLKSMHGFLFDFLWKRPNKQISVSFHIAIDLFTLICVVGLVPYLSIWSSVQVLSWSLRPGLLGDEIVEINWSRSLSHRCCPSVAAATALV